MRIKLSALGKLMAGGMLAASLAVGITPALA